eukprot:Transcript_22419.p1 GENE.Transcript_22419~~Transcript_22419.p1  ORF type:complete len:253 (+),score=68.07 Transcript_22419:411-1169(+)
MDQDDVLTEVLRALSASEGLASLATASLINHQFRRIAASDVIWKDLCVQRWCSFPDAAAWVRTATEAAVRHGQAVASGSSSQQTADPNVWRAAYKEHEAELVLDYPVFAMGSQLSIAQPVGLHFFEPRYRRLIKLVMERDRRFVFAPVVPREGLQAFVCECHNLVAYPDGRADLYVLPVIKCAVRKAWAERFNPMHPPLHWARVEMLPPGSAGKTVEEAEDEAYATAEEEAAGGEDAEPEMPEQSHKRPRRG